MKKRINALISSFDRLGIDCFIISCGRSLRYLSGYTGSNGLCVITRDKKYFITDFRYQEQIKKEVRGFNIIISSEYLFDELKTRDLLNGRKTGFESKRITFQDYKNITKYIPRKNLVPVEDVIDEMSSVKDKKEIECIRIAAAIGDKIFNEILSLIKPGIEEIELSAEISYRVKKYGCEKDAFEPIVLSGAKSAMPHGKPDRKKIRRGEFILFDYGCVYDGYHSDMTRTVILGKPKKKDIEIYNTVLEAQQLAVAAVRKGVVCSELDSAARDYIRNKGYDKYFGHALGHGIGLEIHETPRISSRYHNMLVSGNVITIEPGIYIPGYGGVRIEDDVVVKQNSCEILTASPKELICV